MVVYSWPLYVAALINGGKNILQRNNIPQKLIFLLTFFNTAYTKVVDGMDIFGHLFIIDQDKR